MCLLERRASSVGPVNMTLAARLPPQNACVNVGVPVGSRSAKVGCCSACHHDVCVTITHFCKCRGQVSPQPPASPLAYGQAPQFFPSWTAQYNDDFRILSDTLRALRLSGWYYENKLDWQGARMLLKDASVGAFILRNSGDKNFLFTLSVQTEKGPTSVRLQYEYGYFRLDCEKSLVKYMPRFRGAVDLIQHYSREAARGQAPDTVWVDLEGCPHSRILLRNPVRSEPPSLLHSARLAVHRALDSNPLTPKLWSAPKHRLLPLPTKLLQYLDEYPYSV